MGSDALLRRWLNKSHGESGPTRDAKFPLERNPVFFFCNESKFPPLTSFLVPSTLNPLCQFLFGPTVLLLKQNYPCPCPKLPLGLGLTHLSRIEYLLVLSPKVFQMWLVVIGVATPYEDPGV